MENLWRTCGGLTVARGCAQVIHSLSTGYPQGRNRPEPTGSTLNAPLATSKAQEALVKRLLSLRERLVWALMLSGVVHEGLRGAVRGIDAATSLQGRANADQS